MTKKRINYLCLTILILSAFFSGMCYDLIGNDIKNKEFNLSISEKANKDKMSIDGFLYDMGKKGYGSYQSDRYDYEEHQRKYEKRRDEINNLKTVRAISSIVIMIIGIYSAFIIYKKRIN
ncbi:hypothetical protein [Prevotella sp. Rep29]|uniref:hypothetical protein n=1 Tax=Prevotella sp. Rep29 TaxID=2691580 RepID=UPI001C6DD754|nr:hypothetical protein [Prevotella sp. Rep29]QYR11057.1 hypothetical protein GRF55_08145 [Prevotella sp. Rep29]